ncbi:hypothetical protein CI109_106892 [Kwoniella shandongensis]|uniref:Uncharacterized protein n=1 Tax=Kwoniella shandongensis TaxID=1734106 RepID=A0A5M6CA56_9TREE|nr:uncharacterized protein CI109_000852 [Kwoniella shandongensis]KAA5530672.1 hypothetical protein CI109_000852 [Kwoniella shandongensis]
MSKHTTDTEDIKPTIYPLDIESIISPPALSLENKGTSNTKEYLPSPTPTPRKERNKTHKRSPSFSPNQDIKEKKPRTSGPGNKGRLAGSVGKESKGGRKMGTWTKKEVRELWDALGLLPIKVRWEEVAQKVEGRDKLSCSNKWRYDLMPKLETFIDSLGDA